ncbi:hypothetical protein RIF29_39241 [Crotalaria pallida]|uniref:Uncharacterized protein n=1 Tax=Crotalaria pallida TaxID=3830 RepID=A0AAN9E679_CROPI
MDTETKNNKGKKSSLLTCFKPFSSEDNSFKPKRRKENTTKKVAPYFVAKDKEGVPMPEVTLSMLLAATDNGGGNRWIKNNKDKWHHAMKAALNKSSLMKKIKSRRKGNEDYLSRSSNNLQIGVEITNQKLDSGKISNSQSKSTHRINSNPSSTFGSSPAFTSSPSLTSSSSSHTDQTSDSSSHESETEVTNEKEYGVGEGRMKRLYGSNTSMIMFFFSLLILVMWGKFSAILYTSIWFYLMPPRRIRPCKKGDFGKERLIQIGIRRR